jgi:hypothetical protein
VNNETFTFEDIGNPTIPGCTVIFEFGIADSNGFTFIDDEELRKTLMALKHRAFNVMDFFCAIRYYKDYTTIKKPQKFDYYLARFTLSESEVELKVFHERGPRYLSPADMVNFLTNRINCTSAKKSRKILRRIQATDRLN